MEKIKILGNAEQKRRGEEKLRDLRAKGLSERPNELPKQPEDIRLIRVANDLLGELARTLGFEFQRIAARRIHLLPQLVREGRYDSGLYDATVGTHLAEDMSEGTKINRELLQFETLLHEMIHMAGAQKYQVTSQNMVGSYRIGYASYTHESAEPMLKGFNEAVVEAITMTLIRKNAALLQKDIGADFLQIEESDLYPYLYHTQMLALIIKRISELKNEKVEQVRDRIFRGHFTGDMMHLRDIEKAYGKKALRVIALWGDNEDDTETQNEIVRYLKEPSQEKRDALAESILARHSRVRRGAVDKESESG